jgi:ADP-ribose pyrophosphatase YjhB (NUDIX family)
VESGETPAQAIQRELEEELELALAPNYWMTYRCPVRSIPGEVETTVHMFTAFYNDGESLPLHEGQAKRYYRRDEIPGLKLAFEKGPILERFFVDFDRAKQGRAE